MFLLLIARLNLIEVEYENLEYLLLLNGNLGFRAFGLNVPYPFKNPFVGALGLLTLLGFLFNAILEILVASG